ncbi:MAG: hypothetical protein U0V72_12155 [Cytophagales bacterium]
MKKDIDFPKVEGVHVAIAENDKGWYAFLINKNNFELQNVMVSTRGYGQLENETRSTSVLRHMIGNIDSNASVVIEPIDPNIFVLNNEFWVSYFIDNKMYDKKFVFIQGSINKENFTHIPELNLKGILHV